MAVVLLTDGDERSALAVTRSLGHSGHAVHVCSSTGRSLAGASRWAECDVRVPSPLEAPEEHARSVLDLAMARGAEIVLPVTEAAILAVLPHRNALRDAEVPFGSLTATRALLDKERVFEVGGLVGLATPRQQILREPGSRVPSDLSFPIVIKPARSVAGGNTHRVSYASSIDELRQAIQRYPSVAYPLLLQQRIRGPGVGVFLLRWEGETRAVFAHRRLREKPPSGGVSVYRESVAVDSELGEASERLLDRFGWQGVAMIEFKMSERTGTPYLMEVNPRFWGSLQLAVDAGVDFPRLLVEAALGAPGEPTPQYRIGARSRWWWGEVDHLLRRLQGDVPGERPNVGPRRGQAILEFLHVRPGVDRWEVARIGDPRPFLRETREWFRTLVARGEG